MSQTVAALAVDSRCTLGEGILWCERRQALFWTDIENSVLWTHVPARALTYQLHLPDRLCALALCKSGRLLLGLAKGIYLADPDATAASVSLQHLQDVEVQGEQTRINDGRCDRSGNFVFGTKSERADKAAVGSLYQYSVQHGLRRLPLPNVSIPNSICFSLDGRTLFYCDSLHPRIWCCHYDPDAATVSDPRVFTTLDPPDGSPDGSIIDAENHLWNAQWGASQIVRYTPQGQIERVIKVPVAQPSCCAIGGPDLDQLYITSARTDLDEALLLQAPSSGGVFQVALPQGWGVPESRVVGA